MQSTQSKNSDLMREVFRRWGASNQEIRQSFLDTFSDDCLFEQSGLPDLVGGKAAAAFMDSAKERGIDTVAVEILTLVAEGDYVASERIDYLKDETGKTVRTLNAVGFTKIVNGKIVAWRDYFDTNQHHLKAKR